MIFVGINCEDNTTEISKEVRPVNGDFYVSPSGSDDNPGTKSLPWRTVEKAINGTSPGKIVVVLAGNYDEFITIEKSGNNEIERIVLFSETLHGARCWGFRIEGDYVSIDGFEIEAFKPNYSGVEVPGNSYVEILNCYIHECPTGGIRISRGALNAKVYGNILHHNGQYGISLSGTNGLIEKNEITQTVQYHPKGMLSTQTGADADGIRLFGANHIVRGNRVLNIGDVTDKGNLNPHSDCLQTWDVGTGEPILTNTIIEQNFFSVSHYSGKGILIDAVHGNACHDLIIRNNVFEFRDIGIAATSGEFYDIFIYNNVFKAKLNDDVWGTSVALTNVTNYQVVNNITADCAPEHRKITGGNGVVDYNLSWNSDGSRLTLSPDLQTHELKATDPLFVNYSQQYGVNDYRLRSGSPAINAGFSIPDVTNDFDGAARPHGVGFDIGAFEFTGK